MDDRDIKALYAKAIAAFSLSRSRESLKWEIGLIAAMIVGLNLFIFTFLFNEGEEDDVIKKGPEQEITVKPIWAFLLENENHHHTEINELLRRGNAELARDHLTWPEGANALSTFVALSELDGGERQAKLGIKKIANRYLLHLKRLGYGDDLSLLSETFDSAKRLIPYIEDHTYSEFLQTMQLEIQERNNKQVVLGEARDSQREALMVFSDMRQGGAPGPAMVALPAGQFMMSSPHTELGRDTDEGSARVVSVKAFAVSQTEISIAQYKQFVETTAGEFPEKNDVGNVGLPIVDVSWQDAKAYIRWLSSETGFHYRLLTETEWEYAARAGTETPFISGKCMLYSHANFDGSAAYGDCIPEGPPVDHIIAVNTLKPNNWGLYHMQGNAREWVEDCWISSLYYPRGDAKALYSSEGGGCKVVSGKRVIRGGSWKTSMRSIRLSNRYAAPEEGSDIETGFRVARELYNRKSSAE